MHLRVGHAVLADDGDLLRLACRSLGELHWHVNDVADIGEHPDLGLPGLARNHRLELAVDGELHVALPVRQRGVGGHRFAIARLERREALQIAGDELEAATLIADRERPRIPDS